MLQCSGRGQCVPFGASSLTLEQVNKTLDSVSSFCQCEPAWADPECRTRRKSQVTAYFLSIFGGFFGLDRFYLGLRYSGVAKLFTLGGFGLWWAYDIVRVGSAPVYAKDFRVDNDLPHWVFMLTAVLLFAAAGFVYSLESYVAFRKKKRAEVQKLHNGEEDRILTNLDEMDGPRFRPRNSTFVGKHAHAFSGYGATLPMPLSSANNPYVM